jgi:hypothetical protein
MFEILFLPLARTIIALVPLSSVIFGVTCHFCVNLGFLPSGVKSLYQTKSSILRV